MEGQSRWLLDGPWLKELKTLNDTMTDAHRAAIDSKLQRYYGISLAPFQQRVQEADRVTAFIVGPILVAGVLSNLAFILKSALVTLRFPGKTDTSLSAHLLCMAMSSVSALIHLSVEHLKEWLKGNMLGGLGVCQFVTFLGYNGYFLVAYIIVSLTVERLCVVRKPFLRLTVLTAKRSWTILIVMLLISIIYNCKILLTVRGNDVFDEIRPPKLCVLKTSFGKRSQFFLDTLDLTIIFIFPASVVTVINIWLTSLVCKRNPKDDITRTFRYDSYNSLIHLSRQRRKERRIAQRLLVLSFMYVAMNGPYHILDYIIKYASPGSAMLKSTQVLAIDRSFRILFAAQFAVNAFAYFNIGGLVSVKQTKRYIRRLMSGSRRKSYRARSYGSVLFGSTRSITVNPAEGMNVETLF